SGSVDAVTFTSSSTARNFAEQFSDDERSAWRGRIAVASIGPITAATAAEYGLSTDVMPSEYTIPALARALADYFARAPRSAGPLRDLFRRGPRGGGPTIKRERVMAPALFRPRRLRKNPLLRKLVRETALAVDALLSPLFVVHGRGVREPIASMPGQFRLSIDELVKDMKDVASVGIPGVLLFGLPADKDPRGSEAYAEDGIVQQAVRAVKDVVPDLLVLTDVCLCQYTSHGHCGIVEGGTVRNDPPLELPARVAVSHAEAGADMVAPSDMMDGRVGAIREALDDASFADTPIMAYSAKYASSFYGPFRDAADSTPQFGDR